MIHPVFDRRHDAGDLPLDLGQFPLGFLPICAPASCRRIERLAIFLDEGSDQIGVQKPVLQAIQNPCFDIGLEHCGSVCASGGPFIPSAAAAIPGFVQQRITGPAAVAGQHAGQQVFRAPCASQIDCRVRGVPDVHLLADRNLTRLHPLPQIIVDDPLVGHLGHDPALRRVQAGLSFARIRILDEPLPVPHQKPDIELVVQDPRAPFPVAGDGREAPAAVPLAAAARGGDAFGIQGGSYGTARQAAVVIRENPTHDLRLLRINVTFAGDDGPIRVKPFAHRVAVADAAAGHALAHPAFQTAMRLLRQLLQKQRRHRPAEADMHLVDLAFGLGDDPHIEKAHPLVKARDMFLIARQPVHRLGHHHVDAAVHCRLL